MIARLPDYVITRLRDCAITRLRDYVITRLRDYVITRLRDYVIARLSCAHIRTFPRSHVRRSHVPAFPRSHVPRACAILAVNEWETNKRMRSRSCTNVPTLARLLPRSHVPRSTFARSTFHVCTFARPLRSGRTRTTRDDRSARPVHRQPCFTGRDLKGRDTFHVRTCPVPPFPRSHVRRACNLPRERRDGGRRCQRIENE